MTNYDDKRKQRRTQSKLATNFSSSVQNINIKLIWYDNFSVIDKIYLHVKDPNKAKYQCLIKERGSISHEGYK